MNKGLYISLLSSFLVLVHFSVQAQQLYCLTGLNSSSESWLQENGPFSSNQSLDNLRTKLWRDGFYQFELSQSKTDSIPCYELNIGEQSNSSIPLIINDQFKSQLKELDLRKSTIKQLESTSSIVQLKAVADILSELDNSSYPFARLEFKISSTDSIQPLLIIGNQYKIDSVVFKGDHKIPYWMQLKLTGIKIDQGFSTQQMEESQTRLNSQNTIEIIRDPEVLFTSTSAVPYFYVNERNANLLNGLIGISTNEEGQIKLSGGFDLSLQNNLHRGESLKISWNRNEQDFQQFTADLSYPYLFRSNIGIIGSAKLIQQDSTFIRRSFNYGLSYRFKVNEILSLSIARKLHNGLNEQDFSIVQNAYILAYKLNKLKGFPLNRSGFSVDASASLGNRTENNSGPRSVYEIAYSLKWVLPLGQRSNLVFQQSAEAIRTEELRQEELIFFGGLESLRGKRELELQASELLLTRLEYRWLWNANSFVWASTDYLNSNKFRPIMAYAAGIGLPAGKGIFITGFGLSHATGNSIQLDEGLIHLAWKSNW